MHDQPTAMKVAVDAAWPAWLKAEFAANARNPRVGSRLLSQSDRVRVWHIDLAPGERLPVHCHVLDYFWTALTPGRARSHYHDGRTQERSYAAGDTAHYRFGPGAFMLHDLENIGEAVLAFTTVEFLDSANAPLPLPPS